MIERPISVLVYAFNEEDKADQLLKALKDLDRRGIFDILNAAVLVTQEDGQFRLRETEDVDARRGALFGAVVGGLVGLLGGPAGVIVGAAAGAATGGVAAHRIDMGFSEEYLREIQTSLEPGSSALIALVEHEWVDRVIEELEQYEGRLFRQAIQADIAAQLAASQSSQEAQE
ncbi:MAG TPA: DUF1269 domain-containing protein [Chloroflexi bacterium]|nr:DUF1269 domain-containing protein [Chloroflexota bacterium]